MGRRRFPETHRDWLRGERAGSGPGDGSGALDRLVSHLAGEFNQRSPARPGDEGRNPFVAGGRRGYFDCPRQRTWRTTQRTERSSLDRSPGHARESLHAGGPVRDQGSGRRRNHCRGAAPHHLDGQPGQQPMIRILIADDHPVVRKGLEQLLAEAFPQAEFGGSATISETLQSLRQRRWDVLVLDLFMPDGNGLGVLQEVRRNHPRLPVLVLSSAPEEQLGVRLLRAGASGYLDKQTAPEHLVQAVRKVLEGGKYVSATLAEQLATEAGRGGQPLHEKLSEREFQVLHLVVMGRSLKEI